MGPRSCLFISLFEPRDFYKKNYKKTSVNGTDAGLHHTHLLKHSGHFSDSRTAQGSVITCLYLVLQVN